MKMPPIKFTFIAFMSLKLVMFGGITVVFASGESKCLDQNLDLTNNLCEQNARHLMLEKNFSLVDKMFEKVATKAPVTPIKKHIPTTKIEKGIDLTSSEKTTVPRLMPNFESWPRPKALSRSFETAVNSLDLNGKKDLLFCSIMKTSEASTREVEWNTHQIDAVIQYSDQKLPGINLSTQKLPSKHTLQECEALFSLILGKT